MPCQNNLSTNHQLPCNVSAKQCRATCFGVRGHHVNISNLGWNELHWLSVKDRIVFKILMITPGMITYKSLKGQAPPYLKELLNTYKPTCSLWSSSLSLLEVPRAVSTSKCGESAVSVYSPSCGMRYLSRLGMLHHLPPSRNFWKLIFLITRPFNICAFIALHQCAWFHAEQTIWDSFLTSFHPFSACPFLTEVMVCYCTLSTWKPCMFSIFVQNILLIACA